MIHVLYGKNRFLILDKVKSLADDINRKHQHVERFDFYAKDGDFNFGNVVEAVQTISLFQTPKIVFFFVEDEKDISKIDDAALLELVSNPINIDLILAFPKKLTQFKKLHAALKKHAQEHVISNKDNSNFNPASFLNLSLKESNMKMDLDAKKVFLERIGEDYSRMTSELEKLSLLERDITVAIVDKMITRDISRDIFALGNALLDKQRDKAFEIYHSLLEQKNDPLNLAPLVAGSLRSIYQVEALHKQGYSQESIMKMLKISQGQYWVIMNRQVGKIRNVLEVLNALADIDQKSKLGQIDRFVAFELFMIQVMA